MSDVFQQLAALPAVVLAVATLLVLLALGFVAWFIAPSLRLRWKLGRLKRQLRGLQQPGRTDPRGIVIKDRRLAHLWLQYCGTLHLPRGSLNPRTGVPELAAHRSTVAAEAIFNSQSVFEDRIHTEFFKHLPGLLTGLGIIGTFVGLINGLGQATGRSGTLDTLLLIGSVKEAFYVSAAAIALAMIVTFLEKFFVAGLHRTVEQLCHDIDAQFSPGVGEEYLSRLVHASEESAAQARILKDALVGDLTTILERLTQRQIASAVAQNEDLQRSIVGAIDQGLRQPLDQIAHRFGHFQHQQGDQLTQGLQDSMTAFADKLDQMLGGQIHQARDLQAQTLQSLEAAIVAFQAMAKDIGQTGEAATSTMAEQLGRVLEEMAARQGEMNGSMRDLTEEMRRVVAQSQADTQSHLSRVIDELAKQVADVVGQLQVEAKASTVAHQHRVTEVTAQTKETVAALAESVRGQTAAIDQVTGAMRAAVSELGNTVARTVALMSEGASEMRQAADQFTISGRSIVDVFDRSRAVSSELTQSASILSSSSREVQEVVSDYRAARETFASIVQGLHGTVEAAKREVAMTSELVTRLESAAQKLVAAQGTAEEYLQHLNGALEAAHRDFANHMTNTVRSTGTEVHKHLATVSGSLVETLEELEHRLEDIAPRRSAAA